MLGLLVSKPTQPEPTMQNKAELINRAKAYVSADPVKFHVFVETYGDAEWGDFVVDDWEDDGRLLSWEEVEPLINRLTSVWNEPRN